MISNKAKDGHLNIFKLYRGADGIENNLTRGLALCLQNDALFLREFFGLLFAKEPFQALNPTETFQHISAEEDIIQIDIQVNVEELTDDAIANIIGVTLTTEEIDQAAFEQAVPAPQGDRQITDMIVRWRDTLIVIEVKRSNEDCVVQLKKQLYEVRHNVRQYISITWEDIAKQLESVQNIYHLIGQQSPFLADFRTLIASEYASWLPTKPFKFINPGQNESLFRESLYKRLEAAQSKVKDFEIGTIGSRNFILVKWGWASEVIFTFERKEEKSWILAAYIWPANTKKQGSRMYNNQVNDSWQQKKKLEVAGFRAFDMEIYPQIKFSNTYAKYLSEITFTNPAKDILIPFHNQQYFLQSGRWDREGGSRDWDALQAFLNQHIAPSFDWRTKSKWEELFQSSNRSALLMSFGFEVKVEIPYSYLQEIDQEPADIEKLGSLLNNTAQAFGDLLK
ncbi:MAG: hypothetical protein R2828_07605 [Saprospiraceae bacterium]